MMAHIKMNSLSCIVMLCVTVPVI